MECNIISKGNAKRGKGGVGLGWGSRSGWSCLLEKKAKRTKSLACLPSWIRGGSGGVWKGRKMRKNSTLNSKYGIGGRRPFSYRLLLVAFSIVFLAVILLYEVEELASQTTTVAGHNLQPTPWHPFPPKLFNDESRYGRASKIIQCSYLTCPYSSSSSSTSNDSSTSIDNNNNNNNNLSSVSRIQSQEEQKCPEFFGWIHHDLEPWATTRISHSHLDLAQKYAAFRVVIVGGKLYVDFYYACVQSRAMFTIWGLLNLLRRYPGRVPDVDLMFDCMDKPTINRTLHASNPLPLFRYCTTTEHFDIPFPDWSFWGWPETNVRPWDIEFRDIKLGSQSLKWNRKKPRAYWKGNPDVGSPIRTELLKCNHSRKWGTEITRQDWNAEARAGYEQSKLSNQCKNRYKIYAEGYAWSVSLKYIVSCGSLSLIISPQYEDFFSRGLMPMENYWPVSSTNLCPSLKFAVDWGNANLVKAEAIGKGGQDFMERLNMDRVYDYMYHLITEYSKLLDFKPVVPSSAREICMESLLCFADSKQKAFLERATAFPSQAAPCIHESANKDTIENWKRKKERAIADVREMERLGKFHPA